ncbi:MAG: D-aminoacyl-tRNA deacylase [Candidatus Micrarchaeota archaeon]
MIILFTSNNVASKNIAEKLIQNHGFVETEDGKWKCGEIELIETNAETVLDVPTDFDTDLILVLSTHKSKAGGKMITAHFSGNWKDAKFGGSPKTLNVAYGSKLKLLVIELKKANLDLDWPLFIEADHHGPTCSVPIMFVEIGSTEEEWKNEKAAEVVAKAVSEFLKKDEKFESVLGIGGGHYSREFTKLLLETELAVGHIAPKYAIDELDEPVFRQAVEKNVEKIEKVIILKKETNSSQKKKIIELVEKCGLTYELQ